MVNDYRNTEYCPELEQVESKKKALNNEILKNHPGVRIIYNRVKNNNDLYKRKFMEIYNFKCSYCGNSIINISSTLFEIDHFICESSFKSNEIAGKMENLVLACYDCNRSKGKFLIKQEYVNILNPDLDNIKNVFIRDDSYNIQIANEYKADEYISKFYTKLKLGYQSRRLDYLLMKMDGLCKKYNAMPQTAKLFEILRRLQQKRNLTRLKDFDEEFVHV
ncbi:HNH endonuclease [Cohnella lubricantis]|uniref:HNH endonuclease n=1 Tax=Cohnella lubricantis TaxID=2163172 RepID=A0A841T750_9BACL|nr:HNH endonuclease [Cohnella lubricantis]MBB6675876.1 HNH endonuclease [Cohnella lubricantis]MBP2117208.1 5-methylcytosine-specific restriction endonuclease McrA [Cohnella lubricantis]